MENQVNKLSLSAWFNLDTIKTRWQIGDSIDFFEYIKLGYTERQRRYTRDENVRRASIIKVHMDVIQEDPSRRGTTIERQNVVPCGSNCDIIVVILLESRTDSQDRGAVPPDFVIRRGLKGRAAERSCREPRNDILITGNGCERVLASDRSREAINSRGRAEEGRALSNPCIGTKVEEACIKRTSPRGNPVSNLLGEAEGT